MQPTTERTPVPVVCAILTDGDGHVLTAKRPADKKLGNLWEFPGGKVEASETAETAIRRELMEELDLEVGALLPMAPIEHTYPFGSVLLIPFRAAFEQRPNVNIKEHAEVRWIDPNDWEDLEWVPADVPIWQQLKDLSRR